MYECFACMSVFLCTTVPGALARPEENIGPPGSEVTYVLDLLCGYWK